MRVLVLISFLFYSTAVLLPVPYFQQQSDFGCGDASLQMVFGFYGLNVSQADIANAVRTTIDEGTLSVDTYRAGFLSHLSVPVGAVYPSQSSSAWRSFGMLAAWRDVPCVASPSSWMADLKAVLSLGYPQILLTHYDPEHPSQGDGHFRVLRGYDERTDHWTINDPWGRDGMPRIAHWPSSTLIKACNYSEPLSSRPSSQCYFTSVIFPLQSFVSASQLSVSAFVTYPQLPTAFSPSLLTVQNVRMTLQIFPTNSPVVTPVNASSGFVEATIVSSSPQSVMVAKTLAPGMTLKNSWTLKKTLAHDHHRGQNTTLRVVTWGLVEGLMPKAPWNETVFFPVYEFADAVGSTAETNTLL